VLDGREKGILQCLLGQLQIAQPADQGGEQLAILLPTDV
jgi:hypothetical protein